MYHDLKAKCAGVNVQSTSSLNEGDQGSTPFTDYSSFSGYHYSYSPMVSLHCETEEVSCLVCCILSHLLKHLNKYAYFSFNLKYNVQKFSEGALTVTSNCFLQNEWPSKDGRLRKASWLFFH